MPRTRPPYSPEFRRQMVDLVRADRDPVGLAREFEPTAQSICLWVTQADRQEGHREEKVDGLAAAERDELARLLRENKQLRLERDILSERQPGSHARPARSRPGRKRAAQPAPVRRTPAVGCSAALRRRSQARCRQSCRA